MLFMFMKEKKANKRYNQTTFDFTKIQLIMNAYQWVYLSATATATFLSWQAVHTFTLILTSLQWPPLHNSPKNLCI